jgi:hypothetical protein
MGSRQTTFSPVLPSVGVLALVVYIAAQTLCFLHCNFGTGLCNPAQLTQGCQNECDSSSPCAPSQTTTCITLKNPLVNGDATPLVIPPFSLVYFLPQSALALDPRELKSEAVVSRQANQPDWVLTPEVSLGPALRSLAPPSIV